MSRGIDSIGSSQNDKVLGYHFHSGKVETFMHSGDGGLKGTAGMALFEKC